MQSSIGKKKSSESSSDAEDRFDPRQGQWSIYFHLVPNNRVIQQAWWRVHTMQRGEPKRKDSVMIAEGSDARSANRCKRGAR
jgi:hypothetical protein